MAKLRALVEFTIQQALFGYDGGHQMLTASLPLTTEARHFLAVATDLSGSAPDKGFDRSYTGVAVPGTNFYALFCTWLAREMPRPGCVWSHVLLIDLADIAELRDLGGLRRLFQTQPRLTPKLEDFSHPLRFADTQEGSLNLLTSGKRLAPKLLAALYGRPEKSVVVAVAEAPAYEMLIFALWSQQWPRLRRNFRFSTGSFADRGRGGPAFDVQVTPLSNLGAWPRDRMLVLTSDDLKNTAQTLGFDEPWLSTALDDLLLTNSHGFRSFLRTYGADVKGLRTALAPLTRVHDRFAIADKEPWKVTLRKIAAEFPAPDEAGTLKQASVSKSPSLPPDAAHDRLVDSISFLCLDDTKGAFAQVNFDFTKAIADLWLVRREAVTAILAKSQLNEVRWTALAKAVANCISADEIPWLWKIHPELLSPLVHLNSNIATATSVWQLPDRGQWAVVEALEASTVSQRWHEIIRAMLTAGTTVAAREVTQRAGPEALDGAIDWIIKTPSAKLPPPLWREVLRPFAEERLTHGVRSPLELAFCAAIVPPSIAASLPPTRPDLQALISEQLETFPESIRLPTAFLLVTLGLQASAQIGAPLLARGFFPVHETLAGSTEPPEAWRLLQPFLPKLWFWEEWDRCLKLRRALETWVHAHPGTLSTILAAARRPADRKWLESLR